ncbi:hypothetical protein Tco_1159114 [Tanacetum coccineum]
MPNIIARITANLIALQSNQGGYSISHPHECNCQSTLGMGNLRLSNEIGMGGLSTMKDDRKKKIESRPGEEIEGDRNKKMRVTRNRGVAQKYNKVPSDRPLSQKLSKLVEARGAEIGMLQMWKPVSPQEPMFIIDESPY